MRKGQITLKWLWQVIVWLTVIARFRYYYNRFYFSRRRAFMEYVRPKAMVGYISYPDAFIMMKHADITRAVKIINDNNAHYTKLNDRGF